MAHYFVTMDLEPDAYPQLPTDGLARIVREAILPSVEALVPLRAARKLVTGGYLVGERTMVFVFGQTPRRRCARCSMTCRSRG